MESKEPHFTVHILCVPIPHGLGYGTWLVNRKSTYTCIFLSWNAAAASDSRLLQHHRPHGVGGSCHKCPSEAELSSEPLVE